MICRTKKHHLTACHLWWDSISIYPSILHTYPYIWLFHWCFTSICYTLVDSFVFRVSTRWTSQTLTYTWPSPYITSLPNHFPLLLFESPGYVLLTYTTNSSHNSYLNHVCFKHEEYYIIENNTTWFSNFDL